MNPKTSLCAHAARDKSGRGWPKCCGEAAFALLCRATWLRGQGTEVGEGIPQRSATGHQTREEAFLCSNPFHQLSSRTCQGISTAMVTDVEQKMGKENEVSKNKNSVQDTESYGF